MSDAGESTPKLDPEQAHREMMAGENMHPGARVRNDRQADRYEIELDGTRVGYAAYEIEDGRTVFVHTVIEPGHEGKGIGSDLARAALDDVREHDGQVVAICPFIASWIEHHPAYQSLVDEELTERIKQR